MFAAADTYLKASLVGAGFTDPGAFSFGSTETTLANPFVAIAFKPITAGFFTLRATPVNTNSGDPYEEELWSLRKRFVASADGRYVLFRRTYGGRGAEVQYPLHSGIYGVASYVDCNTVAHFEVSDTEHVPGVVRGHATYSCDVVVVNRAGAGVCLNIGAGGSITVGPDIVNQYGAAIGYSTSDKFMWRHLLKEDKKRSAESFFKNFSPKRNSVVGTGTPYELYLPDYGILRP
jgi:hypothetical protein